MPGGNIRSSRAHLPASPDAVNEIIMPSHTLSYFLAATPRTGSFLLAEALESTGIAGRPKEYFEVSFDAFWMKELGASDDRDFFDKVLKAGTTPNGVFGAKVHWFQFEFLKTKLARAYPGEEQDLLDRVFPGLRFLFLVRRDKVRQAVSYVRAIQTEEWWSIPGEPPPQRAARAEPFFDLEDIDRRVALMHRLEDDWRRYFDDRGITPLTVAYEDLVGSLESTVLAAIEYLGITVDRAPVIAPPRLRRQADEITEEWVREYLVRKGRAAAEPTQP